MSLPESAGRYEIIKLIGKGAMGKVYLARDPQIDRLVALKTITDENGLSPGERAEFKARIIAEARAAGKLLHPNIVTVFDVFEDGESTYIAMEYLEGMTLENFCTQEKRLSADKIVGMMLQVLSALEYAHKQGIIHRDIKPANIMLMGGGTVKITDFGLAKRVGAPLSQSGFLVGTPHYMSPEQIDGKLLDGRSDLFSIGVVFYELVCGIRPFDGDTISTILKKILFEEPSLPSEPPKDIPGNIFPVIRKALAKQPENRFQSAEEFSAALTSSASLDETRTLNKGNLLLPPPPRKAEARVKYSVDWKVVAIAGASGGIFTVLLLFGIQYFISMDQDLLFFKKPASEEVLPKPIEVRTNVPGATLYLDGKKVQIPIISPNDRRNHKLVASKGCMIAEASVSYKTQNPLMLNLSPRPFQFKIDSEPQGAQIFVDGEGTDFRTPALLPRADCSEFTVSLKLDGFSDASRKVAPADEESLFLPMTQKALEGKLRLSSNSQSMKFFEQGNLLGKSGDLVPLPEGEHRIRMVEENIRGARDVSITITPRETIELFAETFKTATVFLIGHPEEDGKVSVDGRYFDDLPLTGEKKLAVGNHSFSVVSSKGRRVNFEWKVKEGEQKKLVDFARKKVSNL